MKNFLKIILKKVKYYWKKANEPISLFEKEYDKFMYNKKGEENE